MESINPNTLTIVFGVIAAIGVFFGIYQYFASHSYAKIVYEVRELADFNLPIDFYQAIEMIPLSLSLDNGGNKAAENVLLHVKTRTDIMKYIVVTDEKWDIQQLPREVTIRIPNLNPSDSLNLLLYCKKDADPTLSILNKAKVTVSEGRVINREALTSQQVYKELLDSFVTSLPFGFGSLFGSLIKIVSILSKPRTRSSKSIKK
jgi:hypothetical protein